MHLYQATLPVKLTCILALLACNGWAQKAEFGFSYQVEVENIPDGKESIQMVVPVPQSGKYQTIDNLNIKCKQPYEIEKEPKFGNQYLRVNLDGEAVPENLMLHMQFDVTRKAITQAKDYKLGSENLQRFKQPDSMIPLNQQIQEEAQKALNGEQGRVAQAKAFYNHVVSTMTYDKTGEGWGKGDAIYACNAKQGNCTDFHSLFMGMCRSKDIPARFQIGFPIPKDQEQGAIPGYHCWAEFFQAEQGWTPVDISEAWKHEEMQDFYFGSLDPYRVAFTTGRDIPISIQPGKVKTLNYFIYPKVWVDGRKHDQVETNFSFTANE